MEKPPSGKTKNIAQGLLSKEEEYMLVTTKLYIHFQGFRAWDGKTGKWAFGPSLWKVKGHFDKVWANELI